MGLDMYLRAEKHVGGWDHSTDEEKSHFKQILQIVGIEHLATPEAPSITVKTNVAYWRKANAIHAWFVRELADGTDECQPIHAPVEALKKLVTRCEEALKLYDAGEVEKAGEHMQPQGGFFFGGTAVDESWAYGIKETIKQLTPLPEVEGLDFYYQASW